MKRATILTLLLALALGGCAARTGALEESAYRQISMQEAAELMAREENFILLDVRTEQEYAAGHIPGAVLLPNEEIGSEEIPQLPDKSQLILVYCRSGNRSKQASAKLAQLGYDNIVEIGGINSWTGEVVSD